MEWNKNCGCDPNIDILSDNYFQEIFKKDQPNNYEIEMDDFFVKSDHNILFQNNQSSIFDESNIIKINFM